MAHYNSKPFLKEIKVIEVRRMLNRLFPSTPCMYFDFIHYVVNYREERENKVTFHSPGGGHWAGGRGKENNIS